MKILFTGGGTGGHFYPLIAVAEEINKIAEERKLAQVDLYYFSDTPYDEHALFEQHIKFEQVPAGKMRIYASIDNFFDLFKTAWGIMVALKKVFSIFPDVVFAKGGYASFPTLVAARIFGIPVIVHESDSSPGKVTAWAGKFAKHVAVSYGEAAKYFKNDRVALTGQPIRKTVLHPETTGAYEYLALLRDVPALLILGGSSGAEKINDVILEALPELVNRFQVIHQTGTKMESEVSGRAKLILENHPNKHYYKPFGFLDPLALRTAAGVAHVVITRAGSQLFEIASWEIPAIVIPITKSRNNHQRDNAYNYARAGCGIVMEEANVTPHLITSEVIRLADRIIERQGMIQACKNFFKPDASETIAKTIIGIGLSHEK